MKGRTFKLASSNLNSNGFQNLSNFPKYKLDVVSPCWWEPPYYGGKVWKKKILATLISRRKPTNAYNSISITLWKFWQPKLMLSFYIGHICSKASIYKLCNGNRIFKLNKLWKRQNARNETQTSYFWKLS